MFVGRDRANPLDRLGRTVGVAIPPSVQAQLQHERRNREGCRHPHCPRRPRVARPGRLQLAVRWLGSLRITAKK